MSPVLRRRPATPRPRRPELLGAECACGEALGEPHASGAVRILRAVFLSEHGATVRCPRCRTLVVLLPFAPREATA